MCRVAGCSNDTDYVDLASHHPEIFGQRSDGGQDYCKIRPLKQHPYLDYQPRGETCTNASFDIRQTPQKYCSDYSDVVYAPFAMNQTFVTEFGLVCDDQYKVRDSFFVHFYYNWMTFFSGRPPWQHLHVRHHVLELPCRLLVRHSWQKEDTSHYVRILRRLPSYRRLDARVHLLHCHQIFLLHRCVN